MATSQDGTDAIHTNPPKVSYASLVSQNPPPPLGFNIDDLPPPFVEDGVVSVRISEASFLRGLERCKTYLVGKVVLPHNVATIKTHELVGQLKCRWHDLEGWSVSPLGRSFFMLQFRSVDDMQAVWSSGSFGLESGSLRLIKWSPSFSPAAYKNTFAQVWIKLWDLGFAFWELQTLFEIAKGFGVPLQIDSRTLDRSVGLYARILVDVDLSKPLLKTIRVTRENGEHVFVGVEYESLPKVCPQCHIFGHLQETCRVNNNMPAMESQPDFSRGRSRGRSRTR